MPGLIAPGLGGLKPFPWSFDPGLAAPEWRWAWRAPPILALPLWAGGSTPRPLRSQILDAPSVATGVWLPSSRGLAYDIDGTELTWAANATDDFVSDTHLAMFVATNRTQNFGATSGLLTHRSSNAAGYFGLGYNNAQLSFFLHDGSLSEVGSGVDVQADRGYHTYGVVREPGGAWTFVIDGVAVSGGTDTTIPGAATHALNVGTLQEGSFGAPAEYLTVWYWQGSPIKASHLAQMHADPSGPFRYARSARAFVPAAGGGSGRIMGALAGRGGLAGHGGLAGIGGGIAG